MLYLWPDRLVEEEIERTLWGPIDLPAGKTTLEHCCPALLYLGASEEDATFAIILEAGIADGYLVGECGECDAVFRARPAPPHRAQP